MRPRPPCSPFAAIAHRISQRACATRRLTVVIVVGLLLAPAAGCAGCGQQWIGAISGPINDPENRTLRRSILAWGLSEFCKEMTSRSAPMNLTADGPAIGRFYPETCIQRELPNGNLAVDFSGRGYAFTNVSKKTAFFTSASVEYNQDFLMDGSTMYAYFRTAKVNAGDFRILLVEQPVADFLRQLSPLGDTFGRELLNGKLQEGFTVIRASDGSADFSLGIVPKGQKPPHAIDVGGADRTTLENFRTEVHQGERDFVGPLKVDGNGRALFLTASVDGATQADVLVVGQGQGKGSLELYLTYPNHGPLASGAPILSDTLRQGVPYTRTVPVPAGLYYVVFDNTPSAGSSSPTMNAFDDRAATIRYAIQVGDQP